MSELLALAFIAIVSVAVLTLFSMVRKDILSFEISLEPPYKLHISIKRKKVDGKKTQKAQHRE